MFATIKDTDKDLPLHVAKRIFPYLEHVTIRLPIEQHTTAMFASMAVINLEN